MRVSESEACHVKMLFNGIQKASNIIEIIIYISSLFIQSAQIEQISISEWFPLLLASINTKTDTNANEFFYKLA